MTVMERTNAQNEAVETYLFTSLGEPNRTEPGPKYNLMVFIIGFSKYKETIEAMSNVIRNGISIVKTPSGIMFFKYNIIL